MAAGQHLPSSSSRALVVVAAETRDARSHRPVSRPAPFLAQVIASARRLPQARERRRADAAEVIAAYQDTVQRIRNLNLIGQREHEQPAHVQRFDRSRTRSAITGARPR
jgi:hypothetical protein